MSSFRPSPDLRSREFVPMRIRGNAPDFLDLAGEGPLSADPEPGPGGVASIRRDAPGEETPIASEWPPERIEELERAAFERGVESARDEARDLERVCGVLEEAASRLERAALATVRENREGLVDLASRIAAKWVGAELRIDPDRFHRVLERAIEASGDAGNGFLFLNPSDLEALRARAADRVTAWTIEHALVVESDGALEPGAFRIELGDRLVDGRLETIRSRLVQALDEALEADLPEREE